MGWILDETTNNMTDGKHSNPIDCLPTSCTSSASGRRTRMQTSPPETPWRKVETPRKMPPTPITLSAPRSAHPRTIWARMMSCGASTRRAAPRNRRPSATPATMSQSKSSSLRLPAVCDQVVYITRPIRSELIHPLPPSRCQKSSRDHLTRPPRVLMIVPSHAQRPSGGASSTRG